METIKGSFWLVVSKKGSWWAGLRGRLTSKKPDLKAGERAVKLEVVLPAAIFDEPELVVRVEVDDAHVLAPSILAHVRGLPSEAMEVFAVQVEEIKREALEKMEVG